MDLNVIRANLAGKSPVPQAAPVQTGETHEADATTRLQSLSRLKTTKPRPRILSRFIARFDGPVSWVRKHPRHPCCIVGVLTILDRAVPLDGLVTEISLGGALFRPASDFIFDRSGELISLRFADREWRGQIVNVRKRGYGIKLESEVEEAEIDDILARFGLDLPTADH
jgi:hypothetical protein